MAKQDREKWLGTCQRDPSNPAHMPASLGALTGQDVRALTAISACWELYSCADRHGEAALEAIRILLCALQPQCRVYARELIAFSLDWSHRDRLWPLVSSAPEPTG